MDVVLWCWRIILQFILINFIFIKGKSDLVYCVDRGGRNSSDCLNIDNGCCSSLSLLLTYFYAQDQNTSRLMPPQITVEIHSDLYLNTTVHFKNMSRVEIRGINYSLITCLESNGKIDAGLYFKNVNNTMISDLSFLNCGSLQESTSQYNHAFLHDFAYFNTSLYFLQCTNLALINISINRGKGIGAALFNVVGQVTISHSTFESNRANPDHAKHQLGGGGLYIEFTDSPPGISYSGKDCTQAPDGCQNSKYSIENCTFLNNTADMAKDGIRINSQPPFQGFGRGGGLAIYLNGNTQRCSITIESCHFHNNFAVVGGGIFIMFRESPSHNAVIVKDCDFINNTGLIYSKRFNGQKFRSGGGGGGCGGFLFSKNESNNPINNSLSFINCQFVGNTAGGSGGGLSLFSTKGTTNNITIVRCKLSNNSAYVASALDFAPEIHDRLGSGVLPTPILQDCTFIGNYVRNHVLHNSSHLNTSLNGIITVFISSFQVHFHGEILFRNNQETALHLFSASVILAKRSSVRFIGNHAKYGGAVTMLGFSVIFVHDECHLEFINNTAIAKGGAFYVHSSDHQHETHFSLSCFMQYKGTIGVADKTIGILRFSFKITVLSQALVTCSMQHHSFLAYTRIKTISMTIFLKALGMLLLKLTAQVAWI